MKRLVVVSVLVAIVAVGGCAGSAPPASRSGHDGSAALAGGASALALLDSADALYREALGYYVTDEWEEAGRLLEEALSLLDRIEVRGGDVESARSSLRTRVLYFGAIVADHGYAFDEPEPAARAESGEALAAETGDRAFDEEPRFSIPIVVNDRVDKWLRYFQGDGRPEMSRWLARRSKYAPMIEAALAEEGLPSELLYLAMIESGLNPMAYSRAHAAGMWQFISSRARMYDLRVDWWVDERRDPEKATRAACAYLKDLHEMFGSWELALAGYNSGEGRVARARTRRPSCPDYWCLDLPRETENFVPKFMAAVLIGSDPESFGFDSSKREPPLEYDTITVSDAIDLELIAEVAGAAQEDIARLNPALRRWCTPPSTPGTSVHVPKGTAEQCVAELAQIPPERRVTWRRHKIGRGETLSEIAAAYRTSTSAIVSVNGIRNPNRIRSGDYLIIPIGPDGESLSGERYAGLADEVTYRVRPGDTISSIARRHGKRTRDVLRWNGLNWNSKIYPGDTVKILGM